MARPFPDATLTARMAEVTANAARAPGHPSRGIAATRGLRAIARPAPITWTRVHRKRRRQPTAWGRPPGWPRSVVDGLPLDTMPRCPLTRGGSRRKMSPDTLPPDDGFRDGRVNRGVDIMRLLPVLRVSTDDQGLGLEAQLHAIGAWADRQSPRPEVLPPFVDDGVSGAAPIDRRPALIEALAALGPGDALIVAKRDRLGRDPILVAMIEAAAARKGGRVISAAGEGTDGDDPSSILMRRLVDAFAEYERLMIKARTKAALAAKRRKGERISRHLPYGKCLGPDGLLVDDPGELAVLARIAGLAVGGKSLRAIAADLNAAGVPAKAGGAWSGSVVGKLMPRARGLAGDGRDGEAA
jgi:DNA invertase Pin-like site-specific DNA recombinase